MTRKKRETHFIDPETIKENVSKSKYEKDKKDQLLHFSLTLNDLLSKKDIHQEEVGKSLDNLYGVEFADKVNIGVTSISLYRNGSRFPSTTYIDRIANALGVSREYMLGKSEVKKFDNIELNKMFGLNDNAIEMLQLSIPKESINTIFDNDLDSINYLFEEISEYKKKVSKLNELVNNNASDFDIVWAKREVSIESHCLQDAFIDLINKNINR